MMYNGAKSKVRGFTHIIQSLIPPGGVYWEPFVGSGRIMERITGCQRFGSDTNVHIIDLLKAIRSGWRPPRNVTADEHKHWREQANAGVRDPMIGFVGHGCSFSGVFFGGFARNKRGSTDPRDNRAMQSRTSLFKQRPRLMDVSLRIRDFRKPFWGPKQPDVIYCDPPYAGTSAVGMDRKTKTEFPSDAFYEWCKVQAAKGSVVLISEYTCPIKEAEVIWTKTYFKSLRSSDGVRHKVERLYCLYPPNRTTAKVGFGF